MYIKNNNKKYICSLSDKSDFVTQVTFILNIKPNFTEDLISLYSSENIKEKIDKELRTISRSNFQYELLEEKNNKFYYTLTNIAPKTEEEVAEEASQLLVQEKNKKINILKRRFNDLIVHGIEFNNEHFSFEEHDQQNITSICSYLNIKPEITEYPYHANGKEFKTYPKDFFFQLQARMLEHITKYQSKYQDLKHQINNIQTLDELMKFNMEGR